MNRIIILFIVAVLITACGEVQQPDIAKEKEVAKEQLIANIKKTEAKLYSSENAAMNMGEAQEIIELYKEYANQFPLDKDAAEYLFKASDVSLGLQKYLEADKILDRIIRDYKTFDKLVEVYYLKAFIYDVHLKQKGKAQEAYQLVIEKFPESKWADEASAAKKILTLSDEELIKQFEEKNKQQ